MERNLLIIGAGIYGLVACEIAFDMECFSKIGFADSSREFTVDGRRVTGSTDDLDRLTADYQCAVVAIGNPKVRLSLIERLEQARYDVISLISPRAYISPSVKIESGCIIEPMAVVQSACVLEKGCILSAGSVVNHGSKCCAGVHVDINATVAGCSLVPAGTKVSSGEVYKGMSISIEDLFETVKA